MYRQIAKGFVMTMLVVGVALVTAAISANAQSHRVNADIPFEFIVGDKTLPAGKYSVRPVNGSGDALNISNYKAETSAVRLTNVIQAKRGKTNARLVFHRYGQRYFLCEVWSGDQTGRQLLKSKQERAIEKEMSSIASKTDFSNDGYEVVEIVARFN